MRLRVILFILAVLLAARCQPPHEQAAADVPAPLAADTLVGAWTGEWMAPLDGGAEGAVELILSRVPGRNGVLGQFTFVSGGMSRTLRYEGSIDNGTLRFPLVGAGRIVLQPQRPVPPGSAARLSGEWMDERGALPASQGVLQLSRAR
jgi:hypothetical protein